MKLVVKDELSATSQTSTGSLNLCTFSVSASIAPTGCEGGVGLSFFLVFSWLALALRYPSQQPLHHRQLVLVPEK